MNDLPYVLALLFLLALFLRLDFVFYIIYVVGAIWALARWGTPRSLAAVRIRRHFTDHAFLGETIPVAIEIENSSRLPLPWLRVTEALPVELATAAQIKRVHSLRPRNTLQIRYDLHCTRRGYYPVGPLQLTTGDLFGFAPVQHRQATGQAITVYPRIVPLAALGLPARLPFGTLASRERIFEDPARPRGVRAYTPGDSQRRIHWKASAHSNELLVRQYSPAISLESTILLNLSVHEYERQWRYSASEWAITVAASLAVWLESARQAVGLDVLAASSSLNSSTETLNPTKQTVFKVPARPGRLHLMKVLETLARCELLDTPEPFAVWARRAAAPLAWGSTALVVTPSGDEATVQGLHQLVRQGLNVVLLVVEPYHRFEIVQQRARLLGITAYPVANEDELHRLQAQGQRGPA